MGKPIETGKPHHVQLTDITNFLERYLEMLSQGNRVDRVYAITIKDKYAVIIQDAKEGHFEGIREEITDHVTSAENWNSVLRTDFESPEGTFEDDLQHFSLDREIDRIKSALVSEGGLAPQLSVVAEERLQMARAQLEQTKRSKTRKELEKGEQVLQELQAYQGYLNPATQS